MGLAERFVEHGQVVRRFRFYADGKPRLSLDLSRNGTRFGFMLDIPQHQTECLLRARVAELGGVIEQRAELTGLTDEAAGVTARVRDARRPGTRDHRRLRGRLRRRAQPGPPRARPARSRVIRTRRTGCWPTSGWTGLGPRTRCMPSSGPTACR